MGTAARLSGFLALLLVAVLGLSAWVSWLSFSRRSSAQATSVLAAQLASFEKAASARGSTALSSWTLSYLSTNVMPAGQHMIVSLPGSVRYGSAGTDDLLRESVVAQATTPPPSSTTQSTISTSNGTALIAVAPIRQGSTVLGSVLVSFDLTSLRADQHRVLLLAFIEAGIALIAAVLGSYLLLRRLLGTVTRITTTAKTIEQGDLNRRLGAQLGGDEVSELASTFDQMLDRIDQVMDVQRRLLSDVSHQLKTPLTVMRGHLEVLGRTGVDDPAEVGETIEIVVGEIEHMRELIEQLLLLGSALEPDFTTMAPVDLRSFMADLAASAEVLGDRGVVLSELPDLVISADEAKLRGALLNLIDNAVKATSDGDTIELGSRHEAGSGEIVLWVGDSGPGIPIEERSRVLERFGRPDTEKRAGSGLGVAIVGAVAGAHGGRLELGTSRLGGLEARMVLPREIVIAADRREDI
jgi:signal transduction histidine kinase